MEKTLVKMTDDYAKHSTVQGAMNNGFIPIVRTTVARMIEESPERFGRLDQPFTIADLGCATGGNSIPIYRALIEEVRRVSPELKVVIYQNDLTEDHLKGSIRTTREALRDHEGVYVYLAPGSFYESLFPEGAIDFVFSMVAIHWARESPACHDNTAFFMTEEAMQSEAFQPWHRRATIDWNDFLEMRERELRRSGRMLISTVSVVDEHGRVQGGCQMCKRSKGVLKRLLAQRGLERLEPFVTVPMVIRSKEQYEAPFTNATVKSLKLLECDIVSAPNPLLESCKTARYESEAAELASRSLAAYTRSVMANGLMSQGFDAEWIERLMDEYYNGLLLQEIREHMSDFMYDRVSSIYVTIKKE